MSTEIEPAFNGSPERTWNKHIAVSLFHPHTSENSMPGGIYSFGGIKNR